jgi:hypothetical protein
MSVRIGEFQIGIRYGLDSETGKPELGFANKDLTKEAGR